MSKGRTDGRLEVACPCCRASLVVDARSGQVLTHKEEKRPLAGGRSFDTLLAGLDDEKTRAAATFEREVAALKDRDRLLDSKFEEALRRAEEEEDEATPPVRPWDLD